jgi:hypothetical protein
MIRKIKILLTAIIVFAGLFGCEKDSDLVIDPSSTTVDYSVAYVTAPDTLIYSTQNSYAVVTAKVYSPQGIKTVSVSVLDPAGNNFAQIEMKDNGNSMNADALAGDSVYSAKIQFSENDSKGSYDLRFAVSIGNAPKKVFARATIYFENNSKDYPPVLSNLTMPDTVEIGTTFSFSVQASDSNGLSDIKEVYYELYNPSGQKITNQQGISQFPLSDNGDTDATGDELAGDGTFTQKLYFPQGQPTGKWKFKFTAVDKSGFLSNSITHFLEVK